MIIQRRHAALQFGPILDRGNFDGNRGAKICAAALEALLTGTAQFKHRSGFGSFVLSECDSAEK